MRKVLLAMAVIIGICAFAGIARADNYTVTLSTYGVASGGDFALGGYPNIANGARIDQIILSNNGATVQTINWYDTATSTTAAVIAGTAVLASTGTVVIDFPYYDAPVFRNFAIKKSATGSEVTATIQFR